MPFYIRKSKNFGPFRLNLSKSGLGVSVGTKGARLSTGPRGTYVHMGRGGLYYRQKIAGPYGRPNVGTNNVPPSFSGAHIPPEAAYPIHTADISQLVDSSSQQMISAINERSAQRSFFPFIIIMTFVVGLLAAQLHWIVSLAVLALGIPLTIWTYMGDKVKRTTPLFYELEPEAQARFDAIQDALAPLAKTKRLWRIRTQQATNNYKYNAGASSLITRTSAVLRQGKPPFIATNVTVWNLHVDDQVLYFMPDQILVLQGKRYGVISYDTFRIDGQERVYIETEGVPSDTPVIDYTWKYVNKAGGPDRRFKNNVRIPRVIYGILLLTSTTGFNVHLYVSNRQISSDVARSLSSAIGRGHTAGKTKEPPVRDSFVHSPPHLRWHNVLGIAGTASREEITQAYHQMARMYHPDMVAGLAPEFKALAEERMKEINAAYEELKRQSGRAEFLGIRNHASGSRPSSPHWRGWPIMSSDVKGNSEEKKMDDDAVRRAILLKLNERIAESQLKLTAVSDRVLQETKQGDWGTAVVPIMLDMVQALLYHQVVLSELTAILFDPDSVKITSE